MISIANSRYFFTRDTTCRQSITCTYKLIVQCYTTKHITIIESFVLFSESCWVPYCERTICSVERSALCQSEANLFQMFKTSRESAPVQHIKWSALNCVKKYMKYYFIWEKCNLFKENKGFFTWALPYFTFLMQSSFLLKKLDGVCRLHVTPGV